MNAEDNRALAQKLFRRATKADVIEAARRTSEYYQHCSRAGIPGEHWRQVLADALHVTLVDRRHHTRADRIVVNNAETT